MGIHRLYEVKFSCLNAAKEHCERQINNYKLDSNI